MQKPPDRAAVAAAPAARPDERDPHPQTDDSLRAKITKSFADALTLDAPESIETANATANRIENSFFVAAGETTSNLYRGSIRSHLFNLRDPKNKQLRDALLSGSLSPERFAQMSSEEIASPAVVHHNDNLRKASLAETVMPISPKSINAYKTGLSREKWGISESHASVDDEGYSDIMESK